MEGLRQAPTYRCEATSVGGFLQQLGVCYFRRGYIYYITGKIPEHKNPRDIDARIIDKYNIAVHKDVRARRKKRGHANMHYIRYRRFFVLCATKGKHQFFQDEVRIKNIGKQALDFAGHRIKLTAQGLSVRINADIFANLRAYLEDKAVHRNPESMLAILKKELLFFEPFAGVRRDQRKLLKAVNLVRRKRGFEQISNDFLPKGRMSLLPFVPRRYPLEHELDDAARAEAQIRKIAAQAGLSVDIRLRKCASG